MNGEHENKFMDSGNLTFFYVPFFGTLAVGVFATVATKLNRKRHRKPNVQGGLEG